MVLLLVLSPRMKNDNHKMAPDPKTFRLQFEPSTQDGENQDPGNSKIDIKAPQRPAVSRLPVLAKSLRLQTPSNFCESHSRWEDKSLAVSSSLVSCRFMLLVCILMF